MKVPNSAFTFMNLLRFPFSIVPKFLNVKALVGAFNQENVLVGAFSDIVKLREGLFAALVCCSGQAV